MKSGKLIAEYCWNCHKETAQTVLNCEDSAGERVVCGILSFGLSEIGGHKYKCVCSKCGTINKTKYL